MGGAVRPPERSGYFIATNTTLRRWCRQNDGAIEGFTLKVWAASFLFSAKLAKADVYCLGRGQQEFIK